MWKRFSIIVLGLGLVAVLGANLWQKRQFVPLPAEARADRIVVHKSQRHMMLMRDGRPLKTYRIALGTAELGQRQRDSDNKTPEGVYRISWRNPKSCCHLSLRISYPNTQDIASAKARGDDPGTDIMIHGLPNGWGFLGGIHWLYDWTRGCIAVTDAEMDEIWRAVPNNTPIEILP